MSSKRPARQHGFTLIEAMVAMVILATATLALASYMIDIMRGTSQSGLQSEAVIIAQSAIERLRRDPTTAACPRDETRNEMAYRICERVVEPGDGFDYDLLRVEVTWLDRNGWRPDFHDDFMGVPSPVCTDEATGEESVCLVCPSGGTGEEYICLAGAVSQAGLEVSE